MRGHRAPVQPAGRRPRRPSSVIVSQGPRGIPDGPPPSTLAGRCRGCVFQIQLTMEETQDGSKLIFYIHKSRKLRPTQTRPPAGF